MRATVMYGAGDVRVENVPDARLVEPTDAPPFAAATSGRITKCSRARRASGWATSSSGSSPRSAPTSGR